MIKKGQVKYVAFGLGENTQFLKPGHMIKVIDLFGKFKSNHLSIYELYNLKILIKLTYFVINRLIIFLVCFPCKTKAYKLLKVCTKKASKSSMCNHIDLKL